MLIDQNWKLVFRTKGVWNCVATLALLVFDARLREELGMPPADPVYRALFLALAFVFGIGYWRFPADPTQREVVRLGIYGQIAVFFITSGYFLRGEVHWAYMFPALVDLVFAILFFIYLRTRA